MSKKVYCMVCNSENPYEFNNCSNCGYSLKASKQQADLLESLNQPFKQKKNWSKVIFGILGFTFMLIAIPFKILFIDMKRK